jgi:hypothetical protein
LKNSQAPASDPLFGPNGAVFEASKTDLSLSYELPPTYSSGWTVFETDGNSFNSATLLEWAAR